MKRKSWLLIILSTIFLLTLQNAYAESGDLHSRERSEWNVTDLDASVNNITTTPATTAGHRLATIVTGTGVAGLIGHTDHATFCTTATTRIRVRYSDTLVTAPTATSFNFTMPAAPTGSFVCVTLDDVQLGQYVYLWSSSGTISTGLFWAFGW